MRKEKFNLSGFMLLEVLLSVTCVLIGVIFVINSFFASIKAQHIAKTYFHILCLIENKAWEFEESNVVEEGKDAGSFDYYSDALWEVDARAIDLDLELLEAAIQVRIDERSSQGVFKISTYFNAE